MVESLVEGARYFLPMNSATEVDRSTRTDSPYFRHCLINVTGRPDFDFGVHVMLDHEMTFDLISAWSKCKSYYGPGQNDHDTTLHDSCY